jgi:hypothetical protein
MVHIPRTNGRARDPQGRITAAAANGIDGLKPFIHFQVSMLRIWAGSVERFADNYEKALKETKTSQEEQSDRQV